MALLLHGARGRPLPVPRNERHCPDFGLGEVVKKGCNLSLVHGAPYHVSSGTRRDVSLFFFPIRLFTKVEFGILEQRRIYLSQAVHSTPPEETSGEVTRFPEAFAWVGESHGSAGRSGFWLTRQRRGLGFWSVLLCPPDLSCYWHSGQFFLLQDCPGLRRPGAQD